MRETTPKDLGASIRGRLLRLARDRGEDFQLLLTRYANERLLFRLGASRHADRFVLKGASLFTLWTGSPHRATRDIDLLGFGEPSLDTIRAVFVELIRLDVPDDGVRFDLDSLSAGFIREDQAYGGVRIEVFARLTRAKVRLQVDVGFGDAITPGAAMVDFPALLDFEAPRLRAYPRETVVAEKLEAMVQLGSANSRLKDFYDLFLLARDFDFQGNVLARAIHATFARRGTLVPERPPVALTTDFANAPGKEVQWSGFLRKAGVRDAGGLSETVESVAAFALPPLLAAAPEPSFSREWRAPGPHWA